MYSVSTPDWSFITSPAGWWAIYEKEGKRMALPIVAWRMVADNRGEEDAEGNPDRTQPYGEPIIHSGDGTLESAFGQGNVMPPPNPKKLCYDFRDGWTFEYADFIPKLKGVLRKPEGDCIYWEVL